MKKLISRICCFLNATILFVALVTSIMCSVLYIYPDWFLGKDFVKMVNESVRHIHTSTRLFRSGNHPIPEKGPPFVLENQTRYLGEDAMFSCGITFNRTISEFGHILWIKNNDVVVHGSNRYITWEIANYSESEGNVTTNLTIYSVTEDDFGMYQCYIVILDSVKPESNPKPKPKPKPKQRCFFCCCHGVHSPSPWEPDLSKEDIARQYYMLHRHYWIGEFHLLREKPRIRTLFIIPGTLVTVAVYFRQLREIDFSIRFTRSGQDIQSFDTQCSYSAKFNAFSIRMAGIPVAYNNVTYWNNPDIDQWKGRIGIIWSCISPSMYGVYQITILRKVYNKYEGEPSIGELHYPIMVYIKPKESTIVTENISNNTNQAVVVYNESCWSDEEVEPESCKYIRPLVVSQFDKSILYERVITRNMVILLVVSILISVILQFFICPFFWCKLLQLWCVLLMTGNKGLAGIQVNPDIQYHLYISSSSFSADRSFITQNILPVLKRLNLKVFNGQEDVLPGRLKITETTNAINKSLKCLVIASNKYIATKNDTLQDEFENDSENDFEINCILNTFSNCDVLILNVDHCPIHKIFDKMYTVLNCSRDGLNERDQTKLMQWAVMIPNVTKISNILCSFDYFKWIILICMIHIYQPCIHIEYD